MSSELKQPRVHHTAAERSTNVDDFSVVLPVPAGQHSNTGLARWSVWLLQIAAALGVGYWIAATRPAMDARMELPPVTTQSKPDALSITITTAPVVSRQVERAIEAVGNLHGYDELTLKSKISGRVVKLHHDFSDKVTQGELLIEIDPTDASLAVEQSKRSLNSELAKWGFLDVPDAKTDLTKLPTVVSSKLRSDWARSQYSRLQALKDRGSVIAEELEQAKTNAMVAESDNANQLLLARAGAATAQLKKSELDIAQQHLNDTKVFVPKRDISVSQASTAAKYTITDRYVSEGALVAVGSDLYRMVIDEMLKLRLSIPEKFASQLRHGQRVEVSSLASSRSVTGTVVRIGPSVDPNTRTFQIEVEVPNQDGALKTGGFSSARIILEEASSATTVPVSALVTFAGIHKVFVVTGDTVKEYKVKLGQETPDWVEIVEPPLPSDAQVVVTGNSQLADGTTVWVREPKEDLPSPSEDGGN